MPELAQQFAEYAAHHRSPGNKATHSIGIPLIALALLGLAGRVVLATLPDGLRLDLGVTLAALLVLIYLRWHPGLALGVGVIFVPLYLLGTSIPVPVLWVLLVLGVGLQYLGHLYFERNQPAFHRNANHMLVGPLWMVALLFRRLGLYRS